VLAAIGATMRQHKTKKNQGIFLRGFPGELAKSAAQILSSSHQVTDNDTLIGDILEEAGRPKGSSKMEEEPIDTTLVLT